MKQFWLLLLALNYEIAITGPAIAKSPTIPSFIATCKDVVTHGYRKGTNILGTPLGSEWTTDEKFEGEIFETFIYRAGSNFISLSKSNTRARITDRRENVLVAFDPYNALGGSGIWTYVFNMKIGETVATEVNGADLVGDSVKARVVQLDCKFTYH